MILCLFSFSISIFYFHLFVRIFWRRKECWAARGRKGEREGEREEERIGEKEGEREEESIGQRKGEEVGEMKGNIR